MFCYSVIKVLCVLFLRHNFFILSHSEVFVKNFFYFAISFENSLYILSFSFENVKYFFVINNHNGEEGIWTLAPLLTTYSLSRRAPSASWVLLHILNENFFQGICEPTPSQLKLNDTEKVGFEPTVPFSITGFQDQLLKPLGHLSICFHFVSLSQATHLYYHFYLHMSTTFFNFFYFFWFAFSTDEKWGRRLSIKCFVSLHPSYSAITWICSKAHFIDSRLPHFSVCCNPP